MKQVSNAIVFKAIEKKAAPILRKLQSLSIETKADYEKAATLTKELKALGKEADAKLRSIIDPLKTATENARELFRPFKESIVEVEAQIKAAMLAYVETTTKERARLDAKFEAGSIKKASTYLDKAAELEVTDNLRNTWALVEVDASATPREYLVPDLAKIKAALKEGKKVKGWKYEQQKTIAI